MSTQAEMTRRQHCAALARYFLGVGCSSALFSRLSRAEEVTVSRGSGKAKRVIYLFMQGAMSHLDSFDPKPGTDAQGETQAIATSVPGVHFGDRFPRLAQQAHRLAVIRSMHTATGAHEQGKYLMRTSYNQLNSIRHPGLGAWMLDRGFRGDEDLPQNILIGGENDHPMAGFLPPGLAPVPVGDPELGLQNVRRPTGVSAGQFSRRMELCDRFDRQFRARYESREVAAYNQMYQDAVRLMGSSKLSAFDVQQESASVRAAYGENKFGQGCLLARRLVEQDIPFVEVSFGGWDMHNNLYERLDELAPQLDQGMSQLIDDLQARGLLEETLVALVTEFGRTPLINQNAGRDHHPAVFSSILAGAGIRVGSVYGASDKTGAAVDDAAVSVAQLNATICGALGIDTQAETIAPNGRPFKIADGADPIKELLA